MGHPKPTGRDEQERLEQIDLILKELRRHMDELTALCSDAADLAHEADFASAKRTESARPGAPYDSPAGEEAVD